MYILELPFSLGKIVSVNPRTYETTVIHPVLDVSSSSAGLKCEVTEWLNLNCEGWEYGFNGKHYLIGFPHHEDIIAFKIKWL